MSRRPRRKTTRRLSAISRGVLSLAAVLVALIAGIVVTLGPSEPEARGTTRDAGRFLEPVGALHLVAHSPSSPSPVFQATTNRDRGGPSIPDSKIRLDFGRHLEASELASSAIRYEVRDQSIRLVGEVETAKVRDRLELLARSVRGVQGVDNDIRLTSLRD